MQDTMFVYNVSILEIENIVNKIYHGNRCRQNIVNLLKGFKTNIFLANSKTEHSTGKFHSFIRIIPFSESRIGMEFKS
jgi:hypothetical protein